MIFTPLLNLDGGGGRSPPTRWEPTLQEASYTHPHKTTGENTFTEDKACRFKTFSW